MNTPTKAEVRKHLDDYRDIYLMVGGSLMVGVSLGLSIATLRSDNTPVGVDLWQNATTPGKKLIVVSMKKGAAVLFTHSPDVKP